MLESPCLSGNFELQNTLRSCGELQKTAFLPQVVVFLLRKRRQNAHKKTTSKAIATTQVAEEIGKRQIP